MPVHVWPARTTRPHRPNRMRLVAEKIPNVEFIVWPDAGHFELAKHFAEVLREL